MMKTKNFWFIVSGKKIYDTKPITGLKIVVISDPDSRNLINARLSWRPVTMTLKKFHYTLSWSSKDCNDESKPLRARTRVSKLFLCWIRFIYFLILINYIHVYYILLYVLFYYCCYNIY